MSTALPSKWTPPTIPMACADCHHIYADRNDRIAHGAEEHGDAVRFLCHYGSCGEEFSSLGAALSHRKREHGIGGKHCQYIIAYASTDTRTCRRCAPPRLFGDRLTQREHLSRGNHNGADDDDDDEAYDATPDLITQHAAHFRAPVRLFAYVATPPDTNITVQ